MCRIVLYIYTFIHIHIYNSYMWCIYIFCAFLLTYTYVWNWAAHIFSIFLSHMSKVKPNINSKWNIYFFCARPKVFHIFAKGKGNEVFSRTGLSFVLHIYEKFACVCQWGGVRRQDRFIYTEALSNSAHVYQSICKMYNKRIESKKNLQKKNGLLIFHERVNTILDITVCVDI